MHIKLYFNANQIILKWYQCLRLQIADIENASVHNMSDLKSLSKTVMHSSYFTLIFLWKTL